jgi:endonuclease-3
VKSTRGPKARAGSKTKRKAETVAATLRELYPGADCELSYRSPLELLVATILSAQSTDQRVNLVTRELFETYRTAQDYADADPVKLEREIHSTGFFRNKTKSLIGMGKGLVEQFGGEVPRDLDRLVTLPGVARKTANVVLGTAYGIPSGFVVDTHVKRVAWRLGLTDQIEPEAIEQDLIGLFPRDQWIFLGHALIWHGRRICHAHDPDCDRCGLASVCPKRGVER